MMPTLAPAFITVNDVRDFADTYLDKKYIKTVSPVVSMIENSSTRRLLDRRLDELKSEDSERFDAHNAVLTAFRADLDTYLDRIVTVMDANAPAVQRSGIDAAIPINRQLAMPGLSDQQIKQLGWVDPDADQVEGLIDNTSKPAMQDKYSGFKEGIAAMFLAAMARHMDNPSQMAGEMRDILDSAPRAWADSLMRTLQLTADRLMTAAVGVVNESRIVRQVRVAVLDSACCLACVALHGTDVPIGQEVTDHPNGRCRGVYILNGRDVEVQSGQEWFDTLSDSERANLMGYANFQAYQAGKVNLQDFVHRYDDPVFGEMLRQASLKGLLGSEAENYYRNKPSKGTN